jgi:hypothetical protein
MKLEIKNCQSCPFCNNDNEYGHDNCNLQIIELGDFEQLPSDKIHEKCKLRVESVEVSAIY